MLIYTAVFIVVLTIAGMVSSMIFFLIGKGNVQGVRPWSWAQYLYHYYHVKQLWIAFGAGGLIGLAFIAIPAVALFMPKSEPLYGDARWATNGEIKQAKLLTEQGILIGKLKGSAKSFLTWVGESGVLIYAPPRSGKGYGFVMPNMLNWNGSVICHDPKKELWDNTAGFRMRHGYECYILDPANPDFKTHRWNPFDTVSPDPHSRVADLQRQAVIIMPTKKNNGDKFFDAAAQKIFVGIAMYLFETPGLPRTIGEVLNQMMYGEAESFSEHWKSIVDARMSSNNPEHAEFYPCDADDTPCHVS
jgi:type IV secretion system protein VirD4